MVKENQLMSAFTHFVQSKVHRYTLRRVVLSYTIISELFTILCLMFSPPDETWQWMLVVFYLAALALLPVSTVVSSAAMMLIYSIAIFAPYFSVNYIFYLGLWLALGLIAFDYQPKYTWAALLVVSLLFIGNNLIAFNKEYPLFLSNTISMLMSTSIAWFIGLFLRLHKEKDHLLEVQHKQEIRAQQIREEEQHLALARNLHDAITCDLSEIILISQNRSSSDVDHSQPDYSDIERLGVHALTNIRMLIKTLNGYTGEQQQAPFESSFRKTIVQHENDLALQGFHGNITMHGTVFPHIGKNRAEEIVSLLNEIFANILRHASKASRYELIININDDLLTITQTNSTDTQAQRRMPHSGFGLQLHRKAVTSYGGTLQYSCEDGEWVLHVSLPLISDDRTTTTTAEDTDQRIPRFSRPHMASPTAPQGPKDQPGQPQC